MATTNASAPKGAPKQSKGFTGIKSGFAVIIVCAVIAVCLYLFGAGYLGNFKGADNDPAMFSVLSDNTYEPAGILGTVYKGGFVVPIIGLCSLL